MGRAARHVNGQVILYADAVTKSMRVAIDETNRRRELQRQFNEAHGITPESIVKSISDILHSVYEADYTTVPLAAEDEDTYHSKADLDKLIKKLRKDMKAAADRYDFERAAELRDRIFKLEGKELELRP
jgi:excinuclease ABC subunit B